MGSQYLKQYLLLLYNMVSCRICGKKLDTENAGDHMKDHDRRGEIPHIQNEPKASRPLD